MSDGIRKVRELRKRDSEGRVLRGKGGDGSDGSSESEIGGPSGSSAPSPPPTPPDAIDHENLDFENMEDAVDNLYMIARDVEGGTSRYSERKREQLKVIENMIERLDQEGEDLEKVQRGLGDAFQIIQTEQGLIDKMIEKLESAGGPTLEGLNEEEFEEIFKAAFLGPD